LKAPFADETKNKSWKNDRKQSSHVTPISDPEDSDDSIDVEELIPNWLSLRSQLYQIDPGYFNRSKKAKMAGRQGNNNLEQDGRVNKLNQKLLNIEKDVLFDKFEAESRWRDVLDQLRNETAYQKEKQRGTDSNAAKTSSKQKNDVEEEQIQDISSGDDGDSVDLLGSIFSTEVIVTELTSTGEPTDVYISIRDFGQPPGLQPRRVLEEFCKARYDPSVIITVWIGN
jgi:ATP-dependent RNA helicase DHX29